MVRNYLNRRWVLVVLPGLAAALSPLSGIAQQLETTGELRRALNGTATQKVEARARFANYAEGTRQALLSHLGAGQLGSCDPALDAEQPFDQIVEAILKTDVKFYGEPESRPAMDSVYNAVVRLCVPSKQWLLLP